MKICAIICEFNPFHNGHKYLIDRAKEATECDAVLCIMSGSFTQRGDICIQSKSDRARHAILNGADCVLELPAAFAVAPAEIFARGAIKILSSIPKVSCLAFGSESGNEEDFCRAADILLNESDQFRSVLKNALDSGESYIKSYEKAFKACGGEPEFLSKPNNILGLEYVKAIKAARSKIAAVPIKRVGGGYSDVELKFNLSSATAIRKNIGSPLVKNNVPECVFKDLKDFSEENATFEKLLRFAVVSGGTENIKKVYGCAEGIENKIYALAHSSLSEIIESCTSRRYSSSRIKRILTANLLGLYSGDCEQYLKSTLYLKPLAVSKDCADKILTALAESEFPLICKQRDLNVLPQTARKCFESDLKTSSIWNFIAGKPDNGFEYMQLI